jgi:hypothetical protein
MLDARRTLRRGLRAVSIVHRRPAAVIDDGYRLAGEPIQKLTENRWKPVISPSRDG